jgi:recombination protein RecA
MYNVGISRPGDTLDLAVKYEIVDKSGAWFEYDGAKIGQGREAAKQFLIENPKALKDIEKAVREHAFSK